MFTRRPAGRVNGKAVLIRLQRMELAVSVSPPVGHIRIMGFRVSGCGRSDLQHTLIYNFFIMSPTNSFQIIRQIIFFFLNSV